MTEKPHGGGRAQYYVLDAASGLRRMWFDKDHPGVVFLDWRGDQELEADRKLYEQKRGRPGRRECWRPKVKTLKADFRWLPFADGTFIVVVWDPPHLKHLGAKSLFRMQFGCLNRETWPDDIKRGAAELWRVLQPGGVLIFKWNDNQIPWRSVVRLFPAKPLFGQVSAGSKGRHGALAHTRWFTFLKPPEEVTK